MTHSQGNVISFTTKKGPDGVAGDDEHPDGTDRDEATSAGT